MNTPANWLDAVFLINLASRPDRLAQAQEEFDKVGLRPSQYHRFEAYGGLLNDKGQVCGNRGCTASHRGVLEVIAFHGYQRALVLEDDFMLRPTMAETFRHTFNAVTKELPDDFKMLYLGGSYGANPKRRYSPHLIETNEVMTTSSYVISAQQAKRMAPHISGVGPIDSLYGRFNREPGCFMAYPRFFVQRPGYSDLQERDTENVTSMEDSAHEDMLLEGKWNDGPPVGTGTALFLGHVQRREVSSPAQYEGTQVIVDGSLYVVVKANLPAQFPPQPWFRGCPCTYLLRLP